MVEFSKWLNRHPHTRNALARERIQIAMQRIPSVLEREVVACQRTLEQKISDQGPTNQRIDPHLLGLAIREMAYETHRITTHTVDQTGNVDWYSYPATPETAVADKLPGLATLYASVARGNFRNLIGDALELVVLDCLTKLNAEKPRFGFLGSLAIDEPTRPNGSLRKIEPPQTLSGHTSQGYPDYVLVGFETGPISIECKNLREWLYPNDGRIKELIRKCLENHSTPLLVGRRIHYTTIRNFLVPAGILSHETYYQYYPSNQLELIEKVKHKRSLGFSDVRPANLPHGRTGKFFSESLPLVADKMAKIFLGNRGALEDFVAGDLNLAGLYKVIKSPAAAAWKDYPEIEYPGF